MEIKKYIQKLQHGKNARCKILKKLKKAPQNIQLEK